MEREQAFYVGIEGTTELWSTVPSCSNIVLAKQHDKTGYLAQVLKSFVVSCIKTYIPLCYRTIH